MHPIYDTRPVPEVIGVAPRLQKALVTPHPYMYAPPYSRNSQYCKIFILLAVSLWNEHPDPVFDGVLLEVKMRFFIFLIGSAPFSLLFSLYGLIWLGWGLRTDMVSITFSQPCSTDLCNKNKNNNIINNNNVALAYNLTKSIITEA